MSRKFKSSIQNIHNNNNFVVSEWQQKSRQTATAKVGIQWFPDGKELLYYNTDTCSNSAVCRLCSQ